MTHSRGAGRRLLATLVSCACLASVCAPRADAQLTPDRLYYGISRPIPMHVAVPKGATGAIEIALLAPVTAKVQEKAAATEGAVDLAALFPVLWTRTVPELQYAQLMVGGAKVGPAVVLQPLTTPLKVDNANLKAAVLSAFDLAQRRRLEFLMDPQSQTRASIGWLSVFPPRRDGRVYSGIRAYPDEHVLFDTDLGPIEVALRPDQAPNTVYNLIQLVQGGFYTDIAVHRIRPKSDSGHPFIIQFGDPLGKGTGGPGYTIDLEQSQLPHDFGVLSMARGLDADSAGSQLFLCLSREGTKFLDNEYAAFGQTVAGADTLIKMENVEVVGEDHDRPKNPPIVRSAKLVPAPPYGEGPPPVTRPAPAASPDR